MSAGLLVLTAGFGEGHNAAARAVAAAADAARGEGTAKVVDAFALAAPRLNAFSRKAYLGLINRAPRVWSSFYAWLDRSPHASTLMGALRNERRALARVLEAEQPAVLCSTYPAYGFMLATLAREGVRVPRLFTVVTDSISINSLWWRAASDGWFMPNEDSAGIMRQAGVADRQLHVLGFPVHPHFAELAPHLNVPDLKAGHAPKVLYIVNSRTAAALETARQLVTKTAWEVTCTVGRNEALRQELTRLAQGRPVPARILGWTHEIPSLLLTHHVVISKAGGATTQEALAARCPMIVNQVVPGQEEGNYELLRRHGIGALAERPDAVLAALQRAFAGRGEVWHGWRRAAEALSKPRAAYDIAAELLAYADSPEEPVPLPLRRRNETAPASA